MFQLPWDEQTLV